MAAQRQAQHLREELELLQKRVDWCEQQTQDAEARARAAVNAAQRTAEKVQVLAVHHCAWWPEGAAITEIV